MRVNLAVGVYLILFGSCLSLAAQGADVKDFIDYSLRDPSGNVLLPGRLYVPPGASVPGATRPLLVFLHGGGSDGTDNLNQLNALSDQMVIQAKAQGAYLYVPQTVDNWNSATITSRVMSMIDLAISQQHADTLRLYITGYSNGGGGTWDMLSRFPNRFAAAIEVSAVSAAADFVPARLVNTPILALHSRDDTTAPVAGSRNVISGILTADHQALPTYLPLGNSSSLYISNPNLAIDRDFSLLVHQQGSAVDFFLSDPKLDLQYYEAPFGGHTGLLGALNTPQPYTWLFSHSLVVPEPCGLILAAFGLPIIVCQIAYRRRTSRLPTS